MTDLMLLVDFQRFAVLAMNIVSLRWLNET